MPHLDRRFAALDPFLRMFEEPGACFFLGAGASAPIMPMAAQLGERVLDQVLALGHYPAAPVSLDPVAVRIVESAKTRHHQGTRYDDDHWLRLELIERLSGGAIQAAAIGLLHPDTPERCPQYEVFQWSLYPATMVNFNNDGLADAFCTPRHLVLNVHGTSLPPDRRRELGWDRLIDALQMFPALPGPTVPGLLLPQIEPADIVDTAPYRVARSRIVQARCIALIGYSFGSMDDRVAYRLLTQNVARTRAPVIVVGPNVEALAMQLRESVGGVAVAGLPVYWDTLAEAIIATSLQRFHKSCDLGRRCARCTAYAYEGILDRRQYNP